MSAQFEGMQYLRQTMAQQMADQTKTFDTKKLMWIPDQDKKGVEGFVAASVKSTTGEKAEVETLDGKVLLFILHLSPERLESKLC